MNMILVFSGMAILLIAVAVLVKQIDNKRRDALARKAAELGFQFSIKGDIGKIATLSHLHLFSRGHSKRIRFLMERPGSDAVSIFDYHFVTGGGKNSQHHRQTVFLFQSTRFKLPEFNLRPESIFDKIGQTFGSQDIDIESAERFSKAFLLRGKDEPLIRKLFQADIIHLFEGREKEKLCVEGAGPTLILYFAEKRIKPEEIAMKFELAQTFFHGFAQRCNYL